MTFIIHFSHRTTEKVSEFRIQRSFFNKISSASMRIYLIICFIVRCLLFLMKRCKNLSVFFRSLSLISVIFCYFWLCMDEKIIFVGKKTEQKKIHQILCLFVCNSEQYKEGCCAPFPCHLHWSKVIKAFRIFIYNA